jgi:hypothetical protein
MRGANRNALGTDRINGRAEFDIFLNINFSYWKNKGTGLTKLDALAGVRCHTEHFERDDLNVIM